MKITVTHDDGSTQDITELVQIAYDVATNSMDWGSGFLDIEETNGLVLLAEACHFPDCEETIAEVWRQRLEQMPTPSEPFRTAHYQWREHLNQTAKERGFDYWWQVTPTEEERLAFLAEARRNLPAPAGAADMSVHDWLGKGVRVYSGTDWRKEHYPLVKGEVIGVIDCPSLIVRSEGGAVSSWPITLPMDAIRVDPPGCGCTGCLTGESVPQADSEITDADRVKAGNLMREVYRSRLSGDPAVQDTIAAALAAERAAVLNWFPTPHDDPPDPPDPRMLAAREELINDQIEDATWD